MRILPDLKSTLLMVVFLLTALTVAGAGRAGNKLRKNKFIKAKVSSYFVDRASIEREFRNKCVANQKQRQNTETPREAPVAQIDCSIGKESANP